MADLMTPPPSRGRPARDVGAEIEARTLERAAQTNPPRVDEIDDAGDHLRIAPGVGRDLVHQLQQRDVRCHRPSLRGGLPGVAVVLCPTYVRDEVMDADVSISRRLLFGAVSAAAGDGGDRRDRVVFTASERLRGEFVDWFRPHTGARSANRYGFLGGRLRAGVSVDVPPPPVRRPRPGHPLRQPARRRRRAANRCARTRGPLLSPPARPLAGRAVPEARLPHASAKRLRGDRWAIRVRRRSRDRACRSDPRLREALPDRRTAGRPFLVLARLAELRRGSTLRRPPGLERHRVGVAPDPWSILRRPRRTDRLAESRRGGRVGGRGATECTTTAGAHTRCCCGYRTVTYLDGWCSTTR